MAKDFLVSTQPEYEKAVQAAQAGDKIVLASGEWRDFEILFTGEGTAEQPITLTAETKGEVVITGRSSLRLAGKHLVVSGLVFRDGHAPGSSVIAFRAAEDDLANHSRVTEMVVENYNKPGERDRDSWVHLYGKHNRLDHSYFAGKTNLGSTIGVELNDEGSLENHHRIDHNYFGPRPELGFNGGETIRIGNSWSSMNDSLTVVENNLFYRCDGEHEIISNKSGGNIYRGNLFLESRGTLTLRHGNNNVVEKNVFFGNQVPDTGGVRVINKGQVVRNNYMHGLTGERFRGGLVVMNGIPNSPLNRYHQVDNALIENNSIIDVDFVELAAGSDEERTLPPINSVFRANLVYTDGGKNNIRKHDDISGIEFSNNSIHQDVELVEAANGLLYPADPALADIGASKELAVLDRSDVGPSWYP
jgi:poly(beta-D-mannuronate) lyase